jgi:S-adenosylmethionine hydrolase
MPGIALLTDFGTRDPYVAAMKGVISARTGAPIHDLSHEIAPFDVLGAAWFVSAVVKYWPAATIFVCVIDPGVGTARNIVALEHQEKILLAPDNGLLTFVEGTAHAVTNHALFLPDGSDTFHGRDRFAPVAAALANGMRPAELGPRLDSIVKLPYEPPRYGEVVQGTIVAVDRFGNAITDIERAKIPFARFVARVGEHSIDRIERNYGGAAPGAFLIVGSTGCIEISVANASAAERLQLRRLEQVELSPL